jgi:hypothetical protein
LAYRNYAKCGDNGKQQGEYASHANLGEADDMMHATRISYDKRWEKYLEAES